MSEPPPPPHAHTTPSGLELLVPPPGLTESECWWIEQQTTSAGGLAAAFCHLVRLRILSDTLEAYELDRAQQFEQSGRVGLSRAMRRRLAREWARTRAASALEPRWHNLMAWRRPAEHGGHGGAMLQGLSAEESEWLARKAERLGGLDGALCDLLRVGLPSYLHVIDKEKGTTGDDQVTLDYVRYLLRLERLAQSPESAPPGDSE